MVKKSLMSKGRAAQARWGAEAWLMTLCREPPRQAATHAARSRFGTVSRCLLGRQRSVLSFHLSWAEATCCYGLGYLSRLFQHGYTTSVDKVTNIFPLGKQLTLAKQTFFCWYKWLPEQPKLHTAIPTLFHLYHSLYLEAMGGLPVQLHLQRQSIFITLTSAGVLAKFLTYPLSLLHNRAIISAGGLRVLFVTQLIKH